MQEVPGMFDPGPVTVLCVLFGVHGRAGIDSVDGAVACPLADRVLELGAKVLDDPERFSPRVTGGQDEPGEENGRG